MTTGVQDVVVSTPKAGVEIKAFLAVRATVEAVTGEGVSMISRSADITGISVPAPEAVVGAIPAGLFSFVQVLSLSAEVGGVASWVKPGKGSES